MISISIEKITIIKDGQTIHDMNNGRENKIDKLERTTIYTQIFNDGEEPDINKVIRVANEKEG